jgi:hypothetical protein
MKLTVINKFSTLDFNIITSVIKKYNINEIITAEESVKKWCEINKIKCKLFLPNYLLYKEKAVYINDCFIIIFSEFLLLFGESLELITFARNNNKFIIKLIKPE